TMTGASMSPVTRALASSSTRTLAITFPTTWPRTTRVAVCTVAWTTPRSPITSVSFDVISPRNLASMTHAHHRARDPGCRLALYESAIPFEFQPDRARRRARGGAACSRGLPSRAVDETRPYRPLFPLGAPDRD